MQIKEDDICADYFVFFLLSENLLFAALNSREFGVFSKLHLIMYESNVLIIFASFPKVGLRLVGCYYI